MNVVFSQKFIITPLFLIQLNRMPQIGYFLLLLTLIHQDCSSRIKRRKIRFSATLLKQIIRFSQIIPMPVNQTEVVFGLPSTIFLNSPLQDRYTFCAERKRKKRRGCAGFLKKNLSLPGIPFQKGLPVKHFRSFRSKCQNTEGIVVLFQIVIPYRQF